jgi:hypothetical protein
MILHIVSDEKFIDDGVALFRRAGGEHAAVVVAKERAPLKHIQRTPTDCVTRGEVWRPAFVRRVRGMQAVVFHGLGFEALAVLRMLIVTGYRGKVAWLGWGYDYYDLLAAHGFESYEPETRARFGAGEGSRTPARRAFDAAWRLMGLDKARAVRRFEFFAPVLREDDALLRRALGAAFTARYVRWNYGYDFDALAAGFEPAAGDDVLVGNSATPTNNHLEIFTLLAGVDLGARRVVVPLSYGDAAYRDAMVAAGRRLLGERFHPLLGFVPLREFNHTLARCSHVIMNHRRQQGAGTVFLAMERGARVFLNAASALYLSLRAGGFHVDSVAALAADPALLARPLGPSEVGENRRLLRAEYGVERCLQNTRALLAALSDGAAL